MRLALVALLVCSGCSAGFRTAGMADPAIEITRTLAASQTRTIEALVAALGRVQPCEVIR